MAGAAMVVSAALRETAQETINGQLYREANLVQTYLPVRFEVDPKV